jgi:hypothetical protein
MGKEIAISEEERKRRSERAKKLVKEGKLGGPNQGQGRKRKTTANEKLAQEASRHSQKMIERLLDIIENGTNNEALNAVKMWVELEFKERERKERIEESELEGKSKDELIKFVVQKLIENQGKGVVPADFIDGDAVEVEVKEIESGRD